VTNTLAYNCKDLLTAVKSFMTQYPGKTDETESRKDQLTSVYFQFSV